MYQRLRQAFFAWLSHRRLPTHLAVLAVILTFPALWVGWQMDDHFQRLAMLDSAQSDIAPLEIFSTLNGNPQVIDRYMDQGILPWWTTPEYRLAFFRFLSIFTMWLDYQLWPNSSALMHLQSLLWLGALVAAAAVFYRRIMGTTHAAGLAALLYAIDDAHAFPASWLANRNALLATFFGVLCLLAYARWRQEGWRWGAVLSPFCLVLAFLSGEAALATVAYLFAYALFLDQACWHRRLLALIPNGGVLFSWAFVYRYFGFGAYGSGFYLDPVGNPLAFALSFFQRAPLLLFGQWSPVPAELAGLVPDALAHTIWLVSLGFVVLLVFLFSPLSWKDRVARFWSLGMLLSLLPITAVFPANRLLFFVGLGAMGLLAQFLNSIIGRDERLPVSRTWQIPARIMAIFFVIVHLILAPLNMPVGAYSAKHFGEPMRTTIASIPDDPQLAQQDLILVNPPDYLMFVTHIATLQSLEGKPVPRRLRALAAGPVPVEITRVDERTLRMRIQGELFSGVLGRLFRGREHPMIVGQEIHLTGLTIQVTALTAAGDPQEVVYRFSTPLEDPSLRWLRWEAGIYVPFTPPLLGQSVALPASRGPFELLHR